MQSKLPPDSPPSHARAIDVGIAFERSGVSELFSAFGGATFGEGAYRVHDPAQVARWTDLAVAAFPQLEGLVLCFASDWLGRQFAVNTDRASNGQGTVVLIDLLIDDVVDTDHDLGAFHERLLGVDPRPVLALGLYADWRAAGGAVPALSECVEYTVPLYLGGAHDLANMAITDMEVAWDISGQLLRQVRGLPEGTPIDIDVV
jgi:hypothetical protein